MLKHETSKHAKWKEAIGKRLYDFVYMKCPKKANL